MSDSSDIFSSDTTAQDSSVSGVSVSWVEKYRPKTLDDMVIEASTKKMLSDMLSQHDIRNMTLFGPPGIGKSTLAKLLARSVDAEMLFIPCGTDGTVDVVRNRIQPFCESASSGRIKCIILDEFDAASGGNAASNGMQKALRSLMEAFTDTRFIITCNYPQKIIEPIFSRCPKVHIGFTVRDVACRLKDIWEKEGVTYDSDTAKAFMTKFAYPMMPDIRSIVNTAQMFSSSGRLELCEDSKACTESNALDEFSDRIVDLIKNGGDFRTIRKTIAANTTVFSGDYEILVSSMVDSIVRKEYNKDAIPVLSNAAYRMSQVTDPSLQLLGAIITLSGKL